jgi:hypothetical protein
MTPPPDQNAPGSAPRERASSSASSRSFSRASHCWLDGYTRPTRRRRTFADLSPRTGIGVVSVSAGPAGLFPNVIQMDRHRVHELHGFVEVGCVLVHAEGLSSRGADGKPDQGRRFIDRFVPSSTDPVQICSRRVFRLNDAV